MPPHTHTAARVSVHVLVLQRPLCTHYCLIQKLVWKLFQLRHVPPQLTRSIRRPVRFWQLDRRGLQKNCVPQVGWLEGIGIPSTDYEHNWCRMLLGAKLQNISSRLPGSIRGRRCNHPRSHIPAYHLGSETLSTGSYYSTASHKVAPGQQQSGH